MHPSSNLAITTQLQVLCQVWIISAVIFAAKKTQMCETAPNTKKQNPKILGFACSMLGNAKKVKQKHHKQIQALGQKKDTDRVITFRNNTTMKHSFSPQKKTSTSKRVRCFEQIKPQKPAQKKTNKAIMA